MRIFIGLVFVAVGIFANEEVVAGFFNKESLTPVNLVTLRFLEAASIGYGIFLFLVRDRKTVFKSFLVIANVGVLILISLTAFEVYLAKQESAPVKVAKNMDAPTIDHIYFRKYSQKYLPFTKKYLHPYYYFFFPTDQKKIDTINNDVVSIDIRGFRGALPEERGNRKLAFLVGGSTTFGHGSSSNKTTISGYLNKLQNKYLFVNAGVPSWNSMQEFYRVSMELVKYKPALIIAFDGFNDAKISFKHNFQQFPATAEFYKRLDNIVSAATMTSKQAGILTVLRYSIFKRSRERLNSYLSGMKNDEGNEPKNEHVVLKTSYKEPHQTKKLEASVQAYIHNLQLMRTVAEGYGAFFIPIWQPVYSLHKNRSAKNGELMKVESH